MSNISIFTTKTSEKHIPLPLFIPVYRPDFSFDLFNNKTVEYGLRAVMINSFFLFRHAEIKKKVEQGYTLREHIGGFNGMLCTDSGAFQQLSGRKVDLDAIEIVRFQNKIKTDIAAPLDLLTPPETNYEDTITRMVLSQSRIESSVSECDYCDLAAIQQGGGFFSLRQKHIRQLAKIGFRYYGIGSMVPFFNKNHDLAFTCKVVQDARTVIGQETPMHIYGAGDPLDIAFMYYAGANVFDSSSYAHYARQGYYMTIYGAVNKRSYLDKLGYTCDCPVCKHSGLSALFDDKRGGELLQHHNLFVILKLMHSLSQMDKKGLDRYLSGVYDIHTSNRNIFPHSQLAVSWERFLSTKPIETAADVNANNFRTYIEKGNSDMAKETLSDLETSLLMSLAEESSATYKMPTEAIFEVLANEFASPQHAGFRSHIQNLSSMKEITRLRDYKAFRKRARTLIYQNLRQYKQGEEGVETLLAALISESEAKRQRQIVDEILLNHISTAERFAHRQHFHDAFIKLISDGDAVIDVGCGFNPLMLPPESYKKLSVYVAVDKDAQSVEVVRIFAKKFGIDNLLAFRWDISSGLSQLESFTGLQKYDVALALKTIPVLYRADSTYQKEHSSDTIPVLGALPADVILATASRESMTKRESIEKREMASLKRFIDTFGFEILYRVELGSEFGFVIERGHSPE